MADVFISYSRLDHERVKPIAERLGSLGYSVWWDKHLRAGQASIDETERQIDDARAVLALWSHNACNSTWMFAEAHRGLDAGKLLQLRLDHAAPPPPFDALPSSDMSNERITAWGPIEDLLTRVARKGERIEPPARGASAGLLATPPVSGSPKLLAFATAATLAAYASAVSATHTGVMSPEQLQVALIGVVGVGGVTAALAAHRFITVRRAGG